MSGECQICGKKGVEASIEGFYCLECRKKEKELAGNMSAIFNKSEKGGSMFFQEKLIQDHILMVFELPPMVKSVYVSRYKKGWVIYFETVAGVMCLGRKTKISEPLEFMRLEGAAKRIEDIGWTGDFLVKREG